MKSDIHHLIDRLQGFDGAELQREMTDGLDEWCSRRRLHTLHVKRVALIALLLLTTAAIAMTAFPWLRAVLHISDSSVTSTMSVTPTPKHSHHTAVSQDCIADNTIARPNVQQPVDYYYTGVAEDGYSVAYGHESHTLTYTRYSGRHIIRSVIHNASEAHFLDTTTTKNSAVVPLSSKVDSMSQMAVRSMVKCDFMKEDINGDVLYFTVIDTVRHCVSVRGDVAQWMGQAIRYNESMVIPATVERDGITYTVTTLADSAFAYHTELRIVVLPETIKNIGDAAFVYCTGLERLTIFSVEPPEASPIAFDHTDALLTVPCGSLALYEDVFEWLYFRRMEQDCR